MPWKVVQDAEGCDGFAVVKDDGSGKLVSCHDSEKEANDHVKALYANEPDKKSNNVGLEKITINTTITTNAANAFLTKLDNRFNEIREEEGQSPVTKENKIKEVLAETLDKEPVTAGTVSLEKESIDFRNQAIERIVGVPEAERSVTKLATTDKRGLPEEVLKRMEEHDKDLGVVDGAGRALSELRFKPELRKNEDGTFGLVGYASVYDHAYDVMGGPQAYGFTETMQRGAADRTVSERDDIRLLVNHEGIALARTRSGTLTVRSDEIGIYVEVDSFDMKSPLAQSLVSAMDRGDMDEMSIGFRVLDQEWDDRFENRTVKEIMLYDVSVVTFPANPLAVTSLRSSNTAVLDHEEVEVEEEEDEGFPLDLALAELDLIDEDY